eukprot:m.193696 g.193696  ORF g.193696 m.193696 type:complete len:478 (+) comp16983_c0_seq4:75-1508(+)
MTENPGDDCISTGDTAWVVTATLLVLVMMPGLALFEAGLLREVNTISILSQVFAGCAIMSLMWYFIGFTLVFGESIGGVIGSPATYPLLLNVPHDACLPGQNIPALAYATFQMMFAAITPLLMTGAFAERLRWNAYVSFIIIWEIIVYYPLAHWIWGDGWLKNLGALDFAGGIVIHTSAGMGAIVTAVLVRARAGFYEAHGHLEPSNVPLACVGGAFLWMGWYGFNAGSALTSSFVASTVVANTQIASSACSCVWLILAWMRGKPNIEDILNGAIAGLAGVTPAAGYISPTASMVLGLVLGLTSFFSVDFIKYRCHVDDALDVSSVHGVPGVVGALAIGFAASKTMNPAIDNEGLFLNGDVYLLGIQGLAIVVAAVWSGIWTYIIMKTLHRLMPLSTAHMENAYEADVNGLDQLDHDFAAYTMSAHTWRSNRTSSPLGSTDNLAGITVQQPIVGRGSINSSGSERTPLVNGHSKSYR